MRYVGIDIASERHVVAVVDGAGNVLSKAVAFEENATGYALLFSVIGSPGERRRCQAITGAGAGITSRWI